MPPTLVRIGARDRCTRIGRDGRGRDDGVQAVVADELRVVMRQLTGEPPGIIFQLQITGTRQLTSTIEWE